jgi:hypothetical protein
MVLERDIELLVQVTNLELGFEVHLIIVLGTQAIARLHPVLAHHNDRRLERRQTRQKLRRVQLGARFRIVWITAGRTISPGFSSSLGRSFSQ